MIGIMKLHAYNRFCASLPATSHVVQWGASHVWKVGGKVFAIASEWTEGPGKPYFTFKTSEMSYDLLKDAPGCRPAPYLASRGMKWIQRMTPETLDDAALRDYLAESHRLVAAGLSRKQRLLLGLESGQK